MVLTSSSITFFYHFFGLLGLLCIMNHDQFFLVFFFCHPFFSLIFLFMYFSFYFWNTIGLYMHQQVLKTFDLLNEPWNWIT